MFPLMLLLLALLGTPEKTPQQSARNLLLITIDTLRADHLGCYGHPARATPNLDRLASEGVRWTQAATPVPLTLPAHTSLLTGLDPRQHGVRDNGSYKLAARFPTLATLLGARGFATGAFVSAFVLDPRFGLARGFDAYRAVEALETDANTTLADVQRPGGEAIRQARDWIASQGERRWFAWVHLYEPHTPYAPPEPFASRFPRDPYLAEVATADALSGELLDWLAGRHLSEQTLVLVTGDHGEGLGDHGEEFHSFFIYQSTLRVPLILRGPRVPAGRTDSDPATLIDILPTAFALLHLPTPVGLAGTDLSQGWSKAGKAGSAVYGETLVPQLHFGWSPLHSLREGRYKYILAPREELYDLEADPDERINLAVRHVERAQAMRRRLENLLATSHTGEAASPQTLDAETAAKLEALGYTGALQPPKTDFAADPKDKLGDFKLFNATLTEALDDFRSGNPAAALEPLKRLQTAHPNLDVVEYYRGRALFESGQAAAAAAAFRRTLELNPHYVLATTDLAKALVALGDPQQALEVLDRGFEESKDAFIYRLHRGFVLLASGDRPAATTEYERALARSPQDPQALRALAAIHLQAGRVAEALPYLERWASRVPGDPLAHNNLGLALVQSGRLEQAARSFQRAVELDPADTRLRLNLARALAQTGQKDAAIRELKKVVTQSPTDVEAHKLLEELNH